MTISRSHVWVHFSSLTSVQSALLSNGNLFLLRQRAINARAHLPPGEADGHALRQAVPRAAPCLRLLLPNCGDGKIRDPPPFPPLFLNYLDTGVCPSLATATTTTCKLYSAQGRRVRVQPSSRGVPRGHVNFLIHARPSDLPHSRPQSQTYRLHFLSISIFRHPPFPIIALQSKTPPSSF